MNDALRTEGFSAFERREFERARVLFEQCVLRDPKDHAALHALGVIADLFGLPTRAIEYLQRALDCAVEPNCQYYYNYGTMAFRLKRYAEGERALRQALVLCPDNVGAMNNLGALLSIQGRLGEAELLLRETVRLAPDNFEAHNNLGNVLKDQGKIREARSSYEFAIRVKPDYTVAGSNLLMCLCYCPDLDGREIFRAHREWERRAGGGGRLYGGPDRSRRDGRLRIGYVSPDFRTHSVAYFFEPILDSHDRSVFEVFCYANVAVTDATTERLRSKADGWRNIFGKSDIEAAGMIAADGIDILVDLAGHSGDNRLGVFLLKPAAVQATYLGYPNTTGLSTMDWRLTDEIADPPGQETIHTERLYRLPSGFLCYRPPQSAPPVAEPPCLRMGRVTFGSFNVLPKVNEKVVELWSAVLQRVPDSRILLKSKPFNDPTTRERYRELFASHGIAHGRVDLRGHSDSLAAHLACYDEVDVALDTFPYNGTTTTCEALWMGVPVVTLAGDRHAGRVGESVMRRVGLSGMVAADTQRYVALAAYLAATPQRLRTLRMNLRQAVARSELCDARLLTLSIEAAYRSMASQRG